MAGARASELRESGRENFHKYLRVAAVEKFRQAYALEDSCVNAGWFAIGLIGANKIDQAEGFLAAFENITCEEMLLAKAMIFNENGDFEVAIDCFSQVLDASVEVPYTLCLRAVSYASLNDSEKALADVRRAQELDPSAHILRYLGRVHEHLGDYSVAQQEYTKAIARFPNDLRLRLTRGIFNYQNENYQNALADFEKAVEIDRRFSRAHFLRGVTKEKLDDVPGAIFDLGTAVSIGSFRLSELGRSRKNKVRHWREARSVRRSQQSHRD